MADFAPVPKKNKAIVCPNHGEPLEGLPSPIPSKGTGRCPISKCMFNYEISMETGDTTYVKDHNGNITAVPTYKVEGEEKGVW